MLAPNTLARVLIGLWIIGLVTGCATPREPFELRIQSSDITEHASAASHKTNTKIDTDDSAGEYKLRPGDVIEVLFRFNQTTMGVYQLQPGDVIRIRFPAAPGMDMTQTIAPDGRISLPYLKEVEAAGQSIGRLRTKLEWMYKDTLVKPELYILLQKYGKRIAEIKQAIGAGNRGQTKLVTVRQDYGISMAIIGEMNVAGLTIAQLTERMNERYKQVNQSISVYLALNKTRPPRLYVFGQVNDPGVYPLYEPVTLLEALAISGGVSQRTAALDSVIKLHRQGKEIIGSRYDVKAALNGDPGATVDMVSPNDVIFVPKTGLATASQIMAQVRSVLSFNGIGFSLFYDLFGNRNNNDLNGKASIDAR